MNPRHRILRWTLLSLFLFVFICHGHAMAAQLRLTWIDNSDSEDGFLIERRLETTDAFAEIARVGANVTSYVDSSLLPDTSYCYRIRAFTTAETSQYSNEACATTTTLFATLESQEDNSPVSGIASIHGWAFDSQSTGKVTEVALLIDGNPLGTIPCCSERADVQAAFSTLPTDNTLNSGWGMIFNWGRLPAGSHTMQLKITSATGGSLVETRTISVVKPADFEFLDQFDLSRAMVSIVGQELLVDGVQVRDKTTQQSQEINAHFQWMTSSQSLQMVEAI